MTGEERLELEIYEVGASDLMRDILTGIAEGAVLLTGLVTIQTVRTAIVAGLGAVVFMRTKMPSSEMI